VGPDGAVLGRAVQKRRLALLARLALAPARTLSRDKLIGLLWPDSSSEQARHLLSVSLHELRRSLGEDALQSRGDDVTLNPTMVETDVEAFEGALASDEPEKAVQLYAGPFMDGFFTSDGHELEQWVEQERARLARAYASALERSAARASEQGDPQRAVDMWRRLAGLDPYSGRIARELMLALEAAGDRAAALQHARVHATMLESEFGTKPDGELLALAERLRAPSPPAPVGQALTVVPPVSLDPRPPQHQVATSGVTAAGTRVRSIPRRQTRVRQRWIIIGLSVVVIALLTRPWDRIGATGTAPAVDPASIAVLPFRNIGQSDTMQYFGDGLSEEIVSSLGRIPGLHVAAPTSSFLLRDSVDVQDVAERLHVRTVLEGSVRAGGGRVMVTANLIEARTRKAIWSESYDRNWNMHDILTIQEEIARSVVNELAVELAQDSTAAPLVAPTTGNVRAFAQYLAGRPHFHRRTPADVQIALQHFQRAVAEDPKYALAHAAIADAYIILGAYDYGALPPNQAFPEAKKAAQLALQLSPHLAEARASLGTALFNYDYDWAGAERELKLATQLNPGYSHAFHWYSLLLAAQGRMAEARRAIDRAREVDPISLVVLTSFARHLYYAREFENSIQAYRVALQEKPDFVTAHAGIGMAFSALQQYDSAIAYYSAASRKLGGTPPVFLALSAHAHGLAGRHEEARRGLAALEQMAQKRYVPNEYFILAYLGLGDEQRAIDYIDAAYKARSGGVAYLRVEPVLDSLRDQPRFHAILKKVGLKQP
jgi:TolB-like protein/DNA-binding SARP family transcriptional activator/Tfp pilus assembly protein PilF